MEVEKPQKEGCCSYPFLKSVLTVFNYLFLISGFGVLAIVLWILFDKYKYVILLHTINYQLFTYSLLVAAVLVFITSMLGCYALNKNNKPVLLAYIFLLVLIFLIEAMVGILGFIYLEVIHDELDGNLKETFLTTYSVDNSKTLAIDFVQEEFKCCGATDFEEWNNSTWKLNGNTTNLVPDSCCKTITNGCGVRDHPSNIYYHNCSDEIEDHVRFHLSILSAVGLGISVLQIFGIIFACCLYCHLKDNYGDI